MSRLRLGMVGLAALALSLSFALAAGPARAAENADNNAFVRVVHAAPAAPNVDVYVDDTKLLTSFAFGTATDYVPLAAGSHTIKVTPAGQPVGSAVITGSATVTAGSYYTIAAIGNTNPAVTPSLVVFSDDNSVETGKAKVRVYHLSDNAGKVAVAAAPGASPVIPSLEFKNASGYLAVAPGAYTFEVTLLDKNNAKVTTPATLELHKVTSVFALGEVGGNGETAFKFVAKTVAGIPSGLPPTGNAPESNTWPASATWLIVALGLVLTAGVGAGVAVRRRAR